MPPDVLFAASLARSITQVAFGRDRRRQNGRPRLPLASLLGWGTAPALGRPRRAHAERPEECQECNRPSTSGCCSTSPSSCTGWSRVLVISQGREPTVTLAWLLVLFAVPVLGLVVYFLFGRDWPHNIQRGHQTPPSVARWLHALGLSPFARRPNRSPRRRAVRSRAWSGWLSTRSECHPCPYAPASSTDPDRSTSTSCSTISHRRSGSST